MGCLDGELQRSSMVGVPCGVQNKQFFEIWCIDHYPEGTIYNKKTFHVDSGSGILSNSMQYAGMTEGFEHCSYGGFHKWGYPKMNGLE